MARKICIEVCVYSGTLECDRPDNLTTLLTDMGTKLHEAEAFEAKASCFQKVKASASAS